MVLAMALDWDELAAKALGRQFPASELSVPELVAAVGPIQSQTARSTFLGLGARSTSATYAAIAAAFEKGDLVRGSCIRGTVHTATPTHQRSLDAVTRVGLRTYWKRTAQLQHHAPHQLWAAIDAFATDQWRSPDEIRDFVTTWRTEQGEVAELDPHAGRSLPFSIGLVRRPRGGGWEGQGAPEYRSASQVTGLALPTPEQGVDEAIRLHLRSHGPSSRDDIAWWSALPARTIDESLSRLAAELIADHGPLQREYYDLLQAPAPRELPGLRLLPEFDALLCAYQAKARDRFVSAEQHSMLWNSANGLLAPPLLLDGRIAGWWRSAGSNKTRSLRITLFRGVRRPRRSEFAEAVGRLEVAWGIRVSELTVERASGS